eukprot:CAMPEP_0181290808 /NCGR_PEP_ID=MMETSP1101-20121128/1620_1 /TAXON_ID=46948 /ORGANISM="Rhodomonas abbreviata, Strain Caron Lab Isolate" /LENGTH=182 /DNA_ID=CAMNT_0023395135 /DNA_START=162 /DNA_END=710 /DNA_ORIENTATION=+
MYFFQELNKQCGRNVATEWVTVSRNLCRGASKRRNDGLSRLSSMETTPHSSPCNWVVKDGPSLSTDNIPRSSSLPRRGAHCKFSPLEEVKRAASCKLIETVRSFSELDEKEKMEPKDWQNLSAEQMSKNTSTISVPSVSLDISGGFSRTTSLVDFPNAHLLFTDAAHLVVGNSDFSRLSSQM